MIKELSDWQLNFQICVFYVHCTSKLDYYILGAPASNRLIIEQVVSHNGPILESKGINATFSEKGQKIFKKGRNGQNI